MALKAALKKPTLPQIEEEKDAFLSFINKRIRNNTKKLKDIQDLEVRDNLKVEQKAKIQSKPSILENTKYYEGIKDLYYQSLKVTEEEGGEIIKPVPKAVRKVSFEDQIRSSRKLSQDLKKSETETQEEQQSEQKPEQKTQPSDEMIKPVSVPHDVREILNLAHFVPFFMDSVIREEFDRDFISMRADLDLAEYPDFDAIFDLHKKIFTFSEASRFETIENKIANSLHELELYLRKDTQPAVRERSYEYLHDVVKKLTKSSFFKSKQADIKKEDLPIVTIIPATKKQVEQAEAVEHIPSSTKSIQIPQDGLVSEAFLKSVLSINEELQEDVYIPRARRPDASELPQSTEKKLVQVGEQRSGHGKHDYPKEKHPYLNRKKEENKTSKDKEENKTSKDKEEEAESKHGHQKQQKQAQEAEFIAVEAKYRKKKEKAEQEPPKNEKSGPKKYKNDRFKDQKDSDIHLKPQDAAADFFDKGGQKDPLPQPVEENANTNDAHSKPNEWKDQQQKPQKTGENGEYHKGGGHKDSYGGHRYGSELGGEGHGYKKGPRNQKGHEGRGYDGRKGQKGGYQVVYEQKKEETELAQ